MQTLYTYSILNTYATLCTYSILCTYANPLYCVIIILSIGNTQISILLLCFLYLFVELMITMNE